MWSFLTWKFEVAGKRKKIIICGFFPSPFYMQIGFLLLLKFEYCILILASPIHPLSRYYTKPKRLLNEKKKRDCNKTWHYKTGLIISFLLLELSEPFPIARALIIMVLIFSNSLFENSKNNYYRLNFNYWLLTNCIGGEKKKKRGTSKKKKKIVILGSFSYWSDPKVGFGSTFLYIV